MELTKTQEKFVRRWGEMGTRWGIGRGTALLHGLLYVAGKGLTAEEMSEALGIARSNTSVGLRELEEYGLVSKESRLGERKTYYTAEGDVWEIARRILEESDSGRGSYNGRKDESDEGTAGRGGDLCTRGAELPDECFSQSHQNGRQTTSTYFKINP